MKNSYPDSLISLTSAVTTAFLLIQQRHNRKNHMLARFFKLNRKQKQIKPGVGIKFDNISARKYFVLIQTTQATNMLNKTIEK